ncbi:unnamed protein product [Closterium sp. NIES-54]
MAATGQTPFVSHLLASGAAVDALDAVSGGAAAGGGVGGDGTTALQHAVAGGRLAMRDKLLRAYPPFPAPSVRPSTPPFPLHAHQDGTTALQHAVAGGRLAMAKLLLRHGASLEIRDQPGNTRPCFPLACSSSLSLPLRWSHAAARGSEDRQAGNVCGDGWHACCCYRRHLSINMEACVIHVPCSLPPLSLPWHSTARSHAAAPRGALRQCGDGTAAAALITKA